MKNNSWQTQLNDLDNFGVNCDYPIKHLKNYLAEIEKMGIKQIDISDHYTISFTLPPKKNYTEALLYIFTRALVSPSSSYFNDGNRKLVLEWDF